MIIKWFGQSCFQITTAPEKNSHGLPGFASGNSGGQVKIVIDPFSEDIGLKLPRLEADILLVSHQHTDHNNTKGVLAEPFLIAGPGEYEIKQIYIQGIPAFHDNCQGKERGEITIYTIEAEDIRLCHLGDLGQQELSEEQIEKIGSVDILMIPVGGFSTINSKTASKIMFQIEPKITLPMHYHLPKLKTKAKFDELDKFLKTMGLKSIEVQDKLSIKRKDLSEEEARIIVLKPQ